MTTRGGMLHTVDHNVAEAPRVARPRLDSHTRRVLMISYAFPPAGGSGVQRSAKFAKYLPHFGWRPTVWSTHCPPALPRDDSLLDDLPKTLDLRRRTCWDVAAWPHQFAGASRSLVRRLARRDDWAETIGWRVERALSAMVSRVAPDEMACWALGSYRPLRRMILRQNIDVIYSTYSPASNHLLAWMLSRGTHTPWVADFRDLWTDEYRYRFADGPRWRRAADRRMERRFLHDADAVLAVTESQTRALAERARSDEPKFFTITNGLDTDDFPPGRTGNTHHVEPAGDSHRRPRDRLVLTYVGRFTSESVTPALLEGIERFAHEHPEHTRTFELRHVGQCSVGIRRRLDAGCVRWTTCGYLPHLQAVAEMTSADVLLLSLATHPAAATILTGKIFEYLASGRPILMVGPPRSEAAELVRRCHAGVICPPTPHDVCATLRHLWDQWSRQRLPPGCSAERLQPFTRRHLTGQLASVLAAAATAPPAVTRADGRISRNRPFSDRP